MKSSGAMMCVAAMITTGWASSGYCQFNPSADDSLRFEVASIKPSDQKRGGIIGYQNYPGGRLVFGHATLASLIEYAFDIRSFQLSGGPAWVFEDQYEIEARPPSAGASRPAILTFGSPITREQRIMLRNLLADRFGLKLHNSETRGIVYHLEANHSRLKLRDAASKNGRSWVGSPKGHMITGDGIAGTNISMPELAARLSRYVSRPVLDKTNLQGSFDFNYEYESDDPDPDVTTSIFVSLEAIGLKLKQTSGPVAKVTIDSAEKPSNQ